MGAHNMKIKLGAQSAENMQKRRGIAPAGNGGNHKISFFEHMLLFDKFLCPQFKQKQRPLRACAVYFRAHLSSSMV